MAITKRGRGKKGALELSLTTIITIVLAVVFLILALIILRNMYGFQSESINQIQKKTLEKINALYLGDEEISTRLYFANVGDDKIVNVRSGNDNFGVGVVGTTISNARIQKGSDLQFYVWLDETSPNNCVKLLTKAKVESWFKIKLNAWIDSEEIVDSTGGTTILLGVPPATKLCQQKVYVKGVDKISGGAGSEEVIGQSYFIINVLRKSPFG